MYNNISNVLSATKQCKSDYCEYTRLYGLKGYTFCTNNIFYINKPQQKHARQLSTLTICTTNKVSDQQLTHGS